jgi:hypothetical protein
VPEASEPSGVLAMPLAASDARQTGALGWHSLFTAGVAQTDPPVLCLQAGAGAATEWSPILPKEYVVGKAVRSTHAGTPLASWRQAGPSLVQARRAGVGTPRRPTGPLAEARTGVARPTDHSPNWLALSCPPVAGQGLVRSRAPSPAAA